MMWSIISGLYAIDIVDSLVTVSVIGSAISVALWLWSAILVATRKEESHNTNQLKKLGKLSKLAFISTCIFIPLSVLTPAKRTLLISTGLVVGYSTLKAVDLGGEFSKVKRIINLQLDKYIDILEAEKSTTTKGEN